MSNSYRIRTEPGVDKSIKILIDQEFEYLEILSLKILQSQIYTRQCSDYGVLVGRVSVNNGFGIPNAKVSVFIPLDSVDELDPEISEIYPYKTLTDLNEDGYRYNLLPYKPSYSAHIPTGTFFTRKDVLVDPPLIKVYDKYYKYSTVTNSSGDYMIFGLPIGSQTIVVDIDLSDIGEFSLSPQDLIRMGIATPSQVAGITFKSSTNLRELPQLITINRIIQVEPLWGQPEICNLGITRTDFDLSSESGINITPTAIFMGSIISTNDDAAIKRTCKVRGKGGYLCNLTTNSGEILAIRQTILQDSDGRPILESIDLEAGGKVIDENGTWLVDVPMNLDYYITNEFGEQVLSNDPKKGIPTRGKYRFKVKWTQPPSLSERIKRGYFLLPNIKEHGWSTSGSDPLISSSRGLNTSYDLAMKSYAFSLDWADYGYTGTTSGPKADIGRNMIQEAINCDDKFYIMQYNKVYTVSQLMDKYRNGTAPDRFIGVKNILDDSCESENYKFPTNDSNMRFDIIYILYSFLMMIFRPILYIVLVVTHVLYFLVILLRKIIVPAAILYFIALIIINGILIIGTIPYALGLIAGFLLEIAQYVVILILLRAFLKALNKMELKGISIPLITYPDCDLCDCSVGQNPSENETVPEDLADAAKDINSLADEKPCPYIVFDESPANSLLSSALLLGVSGPIYSIPGRSIDSSVKYAVTSTFAGSIAAGQNDNSAGIPAVNAITYDAGGQETDYVFTSSLTLAERINLFNTKAKYFNVSPNNPGGGVNRIKVSVEPSKNGGNNPTSHFDNTIIIICDKSTLINLKIGQIMTFQNPFLTKDVNLFSGYTGEGGNQFGNAAVTGTTLTGNTTIGFNYANPDGSGDIPVSYNVNFTQSGQTEYYNYPMDLEYFQVITGMTYTDFISNSGSTMPDSFISRFLNNEMYLQRFYGGTVYTENCWGGPFKKDGSEGFPTLKNPITYIKNFEKSCILILNRGVDPNAPRVEIQYDLNVLFGKPMGQEQKLIVKGQYKINYPVQGKFLNVSHDNTKIPTNLSADSYSGNKLYYDTFTFTPNLGASGFTTFNSNLWSYYSALDNNQINFTPTCDAPPDGLVYPLAVNKGAQTNFTYGLNVNSQNDFTKESNVQTTGCTRYGFSQGVLGCISYCTVYRLSQNSLPKIGYSTDSINLTGLNTGSTQSLTTYLGLSYTIGQNIVVSHSNSIKFIGDCVNYSPLTGFLTVKVLSKLGSGTFSSWKTDIDGNTQSFNTNRGYYVNEIVEGASLFYMDLTVNNPLQAKYSWEGNYFSPVYNMVANTLTYNLTTAKPKQMVMRSDRLPTSTNPQANCCNSFALQHNETLMMYDIDDEGLAGTISSIASASSGVSNQGKDLAEDTTNFTSDVIDSFSCPKSAPLACYGSDGQGNVVINDGDCKKFNGRTIFSKGCYILVTKAFTSLGRDFELLTEWISRTSINLGACRNVWSHTFSNNWINGCLYAYSFTNNVTFNSPTGNQPNTPNSEYCTSTLVLHPTNNFYYRCSPYKDDSTSINSGNFIGKSRGSSTSGDNNLYLLNPTTIIDLGPRSVFLQEINMSDDYDGYVMKKLTSTTYGDVIEILNLLIISRLINQNFINDMLKLLIGSNITKYFSRTKYKVDGDYAQLISINSELGVAAFESMDYPDSTTGGQNPVYWNGFNENTSVIGIFFSSDTQTRDFITPKRTIINPTLPNLSPCGFSYFEVFSQSVPLYQWEINGSGSIFGDQNNNWNTNPINDGFLSLKYQSLDRLQTSSRYFRGTAQNQSQTNYYKGHIYAVDGNGNIDESYGNWDQNTPDEPNSVTVGAPFHFYFGLKKGKSAFDRFTTKWIDTTTFVD
jgi:hypothetical protein